MFWIVVYLGLLGFLLSGPAAFGGAEDAANQGFKLVALGDENIGATDPSAIRKSKPLPNVTTPPPP